MSEEMSKEEFLSHLGESIHVAFRKASDHKNATPIWRLISELPEEEWMGILEFIYAGIEGISVA